MPTVQEKDGYYCILFGTNDLNLGSANNERNGGNVSGMYLPWADNPARPYTQFMGKNVPFIPDNYYGAQAIDANLFLDGDNPMYLVYGGRSRCLVAQFKDDMTVGVHEFEVYNIKSTDQLIALKNAGAKIEEVNPSTIPDETMAQLAAIDDSIDGLVAEAAAAEAAPSMMQAAAFNGDLADGGSTDIAMAFNLTSESETTGPMAVVPGSGMRGPTDPYVVYDGGYYYYVRAENETSITASKASRLEDIGKAKKVTVCEPGFAEFPLLRSPNLHKIESKWYLYAPAWDGDEHRENLNLPANRWDDNYNYSIYVLEGDDPQGPFARKDIISAPGEWAVDGTVLQDPVSEKNHFVWSGRKDGDPEGPDTPAKLIAASTGAAAVLDQGVPGMFGGNTGTKMYCDQACVAGSGQAPGGEVATAVVPAATIPVEPVIPGAPAVIESTAPAEAEASAAQVVSEAEAEAEGVLPVWAMAAMAIAAAAAILSGTALVVIRKKHEKKSTRRFPGRKRRALSCR